MSDAPDQRQGNQEQARDPASYIGELELLVSGAALFATLKLPGWLRENLMPLADRFSDDLGAMIVVLNLYLSSGAAILTITFALHLALRARWIALVGMRRAFPRGVRWKRMKASAGVRAVIRRNDPGAEGAVQRAANQASIVFASGLVLSSMLLAIAIAVILAFVVGYLSELAGHPIDPLILFIGIGVLVLLPLLVAAVLDKFLVPRLPAKGALHRGFTHVLGFYARIGMLPGFSLSRLLQSHGGEVRTTVIGIAVMLFAALLIGGSLFMEAAPMRFGSYSQFPHFESKDRSEHVLYSAQYDDLRSPLESSRVAYIQSRVITDAYLRLTVPYEPTEDGHAISEQCPEVSIAEEEARPLATLECLTRLHPVTLDGEPLADLRYHVGIDADSRRPVLLAMIDVRDLAPGRHELRVTATPDPDDDEAGSSDPQGPWVIPFWR